MPDFLSLTSLREQGVINAFSKKALGNMSFIWGRREEVSKNREKFSGLVGLPNKPFINVFLNLFLNHGTRIAIASKKDAVGIGSFRSSFTAIDAVITNEPGLFIFFCVADCHPLIFFDPKKKVLAAAHVGWKGAVGKLHLMVLMKMISQFGCRLENITIAVGPSLRKECSLQPRPVLQEALPEWRRYVKIKDSRTAEVDSLGFILNDLRNYGIEKSNLNVSPVCTVCHRDEFFSAEANQRKLTKEKEGRFGVIVGML